MSPWVGLAAQVARSRVCAVWRGTRWFIRGVLGEDAYERYLAHHAAVHPEGVAMSAGEFWRERMDRQNADPRGRCC